jgi:hypothetical protein
MRIPNHSIKFPYKIYRNIPCPIITIRVSDFEIDAYVDSGAFYSIFSPNEAEVIGIDYKQGKQGGAIVGDGNIIPVYFHILPISIGHISFKAKIGFSPKLGIGVNLLGRKDIFDRFLVTFDDIKKVITFIPRR